MANVSVKAVARAANKANRAAASAKADDRIYDSFQNFALGVGFGTDNASSANQYGYNPRTRNRQQLEWMHRSSWVAGLFVDIIADDMTRAGVDILADIDIHEIDRIQSWATRWHIWTKVNDALKASRLYGGAIAVLLVEGQDYTKPLRIETIGPDQFKGLLVLDRWMVGPSLNDLVTDIGPSLGLPKYYTVLEAAPALRGFKIHHTRCIRLVGDALPYWQAVTEQLWGMSVLERIYDRITHFDSATLGSAQLLHKAYVRYLKIEKYRETLATGGRGLANLENSIQRMRYAANNEGIVLLGTEDDVVTEQNSSYSGITDILLQLEQQISGAGGIPLVRLLGQSPAGLNSTGESDFRMYYDSIRQRCERDLHTGITRVFRCIAQSLGIDTNEDFGIQFRPLWQMDETAKADVSERITRTVLSAKSEGAVSDKTVLMELKKSSKLTGVWDNISDEDIERADDTILPPVPEAGTFPQEEKSDDPEQETVTGGPGARSSGSATEKPVRA